MDLSFDTDGIESVVAAATALGVEGGPVEIYARRSVNWCDPHARLCMIVRYSMTYEEDPFFSPDLRASCCSNFQTAMLVAHNREDSSV